MCNWVIGDECCGNEVEIRFSFIEIKKCRGKNAEKPTNGNRQTGQRSRVAKQTNRGRIGARPSDGASRYNDN